jgi:hypothetical protein
MTQQARHYIKKIVEVNTTNINNGQHAIVRNNSDGFVCQQYRPLLFLDK